jgi:hypothetical protein
MVAAGGFAVVAGTTVVVAGTTVVVAGTTVAGAASLPPLQDASTTPAVSRAREAGRRRTGCPVRR